ncbi:MarR family winged helix-turn-helix transcriptional regulator [Lentzea sp. JNUCC 0626]|uniref:MarR family winged helix-turn-helix transcriptional regulator n=1 Tax=Lentzea sp. JNUCC 0626 TaxID=3367513 RepID=UPI0037490BC1
MNHDKPREVALAVRRMLQAGREMQAAMARRLGVRITDVQAVDQVVSADSPLGTVELGDRLGIRSASATVLVDRLVSAGHLTRSPDPHDRRRVVLGATDHARGEVRQALTPLLREITTITDRLDDDQVVTVLGFMEELTVALREYAAGEEPSQIVDRSSTD